MKQTILILLSVLLIGCSKEETSDKELLNIPEIYWGEYESVSSDRTAILTKNQITIGNDTIYNYRYVNSQSFNEDNEWYRAEFDNEDELQVFRGNNVYNISIARDGDWLIRENFRKQE